MKRPKMRQLLELQCDRVEAVLAAHRAPVRITGGTVGPRVIRLYLQLAPHIRFKKVAGLADDIALALRVDGVGVSMGKDGVILEYVNPHPYAVSFAQLLNERPTFPAVTALLGITMDGKTLVARMSSADVAHVLIAGTTGCGKSVLSRAILGSLVVCNRPEVVRAVVFDPKGKLVPDGWHVPHVDRVVARPDEMVEVLRDLVYTMERRDAQGETLPHLFVFIDELADVVMQVRGAGDQVTRLVQRGRECGIHVVAATQHPSAAILSGVMKANFPLRLVGRVGSPDDARVAAGRGGSKAETLKGRGDFLAIGGEVQRFQVPDVSREVLVHATAHIGPTMVDAVLDVAPDVEAVEVVDETLAQDKAALMEKARGARRMPGSKREAERWLFGVNRGGAFWDRTTAALAAMYAEGFDVSKGATTTTKRRLIALLDRFGGVAG